MSVAVGGPPNTIKTSDMEDGQLGVIVGGFHDGLLIQYIGNSGFGEPRFQPIGLPAGKGWSGGSPGFRVRILKPGETITVTSN